jgi:hypothetical protein
LDGINKKITKKFIKFTKIIGQNITGCRPEHPDQLWS